MDAYNTPPTLNLQGPISRARAQQLYLEVSSFLRSYLYVNFENGLVPNDYIVIRTHGEDREMMGDGHGGVEDQQGRASKGGGPTQTDSESIPESRSSAHLNGCPGRIRARI